MLFSMTLTAQKTYLPLTVGTDTIGFFEGNAFDPYKKKYLFKSTQADKFVESHPDLDFEWSTNEPTYELNLKWNLFSISVPAYSQDLIEYDKGTFTQNGEELSMEQIDDLTLSYNTGIGNFLKANNFNRMHKNPYLRTNNNTLNFLVGSAAAIGGVPWTALGGAVVLSGDEDYIAGGFVLLGLGTGLCVVSYKALSRIALSPAGCLRKRDEQFKKVADKINQAIATGGPSAPSSNR